VIERVVEDWLHNVNELGYEDSFAQALISEGHTVVHKQQHGQLELGKDLITRDPTGIYHAYQLKGGNITQAKWSELASQIEMTVTSPIFHPNIPADADFIPYLVTNGTLSDPVRADITNRNRRWKAQFGRELQVILYGDLLDMFLRIPSSFLPTKPRDFQLFLTLYLADKREPLKCGEFSQFLLSLTPEEPAKAAELRRLLAATTIVADYIISGFEKVVNHYSAAQAWCLLLFHLLRACEPHSEVADWKAPIDLIIGSIEKNVALLIDEALASSNLMSGNIFVDEHVWPYRIPTLIGVFSAHVISHRLTRATLKNENDLYGWILRFLPDSKLWGEAAAPCLFMASQCLCLRGAELAGVNTAMRAIETITDQNGARAKVGLPDPYFNAEDVMKAELFGEDIYGEKVSFAGRSYSIRQFVELVVRRNWPRKLGERWFYISGIDYAEFRPQSPAEAYLWRSKEGSNNSRRWGHPQSWRALVEEALSTSEDSLLIDTKYVHLLPYYFLFLPHRFTVSRARLLDVTLLLRLGE
jgi:hypothetical protein